MKQMIHSVLSRLSPRRYFYLSSVLVVLVYCKPIFTVWAYSDEYDLFKKNPLLGMHMRKDGSLLSGAIYDYISAWLVNSPADLWRLRLISLVLLLLIINTIAIKIHLSNQSSLIQFALPITLMLPAPMTFISWALVWQGSLGMFLSFYASQYWINSKSYKRFIAPIIVLGALYISPVAAFTYFGFFSAIHILSKTPSRIFLRKLMSVILLFTISCVTSLIVLFVSVRFFDLVLNQRVELVKLADVPAKVLWLVSRPFAVSTRFFDIHSPGFFNVLFVFSIVIAVVILGIISQAREIEESSFARIALYFFCLSASITPIIITWSNQIEFRYIFAPSWSIFIVTIVFISELSRKRLKLNKLLITVSIISILFAGITTVTVNTDKQFISPYKSKNQFLSGEIDKCVRESGTISGVIIKNPQYPFPSRANLGIFSQVTDLASPWVPIPSVKLVLAEKGFLNVQIFMENKGTKDLNKSCIIDLEIYRKILVASS